MKQRELAGLSKSLIQFRSRECKGMTHQACHRIWKGLGYEVVCECACHYEKKALVEEYQPNTNAVEAKPLDVDNNPQSSEVLSNGIYQAHR
jgi:hypothetical protein